MNIVFISQVFEVRTVRIYLFLYAQNNWTKFQVRLRGLLMYTMKQRSSVFYLARRASSYFSGQSSGFFPRDFTGLETIPRSRGKMNSRSRPNRSRAGCDIPIQSTLIP